MTGITGIGITTTTITTIAPTTGATTTTTIGGTTKAFVIGGGSITTTTSIGRGSGNTGTTDQRRREPVWRWVEDGYRVIARRPRSEIWNESVEPERADEIEALTEGLMQPDRWLGRERSELLRFHSTAREAASDH